MCHAVSWINFCMWSMITIEVLLFIWIPNITKLLICLFFFLSSWIDALFEYYLTVYVGFFFWILHYVLVTFLVSFQPILHYLDYHSFIYLFIVFCLFRATPEAYGGSQARSRIGAVAARLHHSHSNAGPESHLQPTPQFTAMLDP